MTTTPQEALKAVQEEALNLSLETDDFLKNKTEDTQLEKRLTELAMRVTELKFEMPQYIELQVNTINFINILIDLIILKVTCELLKLNK
ncbi:hypothetical protein [Choristoneura diversana nucleopolyhedrovirus]|nr:hypothetical protein [Choristoneura diversana nucleopolyhedrovirus]